MDLIDILAKEMNRYIKTMEMDLISKGKWI